MPVTYPLSDEVARDRPGAAALAVLWQLPREEADLLCALMRMIAAEAMRQGLQLGSSLMLASLEYRIDIDGLVKALPSLRLVSIAVPPPDRTPMQV